MITRILAILSCICIILLCVFLGPTGIGAFIDPPSLILVVLLTWFILISAYGFDNFFKMFGIFSNIQVCKEKVRLYKSIAKCGILVSIFSGFLGTLIGCIHVLSDLSNPEYVGIGLATALLTLLYGSLQALFLFVPLYGASKVSINQSVEDEEKNDVDNKNPFRIISLAFMSFICVTTIVLFVIGIFFSSEHEYNPEINNYVESSFEPMFFSTANSEGKKLVIGITLHSSSYGIDSLTQEPSSGIKSLLRPMQAEIIDLLYSKKSEELVLNQLNQKELANEIKLSLNKLKNELAPEVPGEILSVYFYRFHYE
ncbi:MAG: MotA/TolQ/ExbB proton channel family protein [Lentisphaeraceae bacterium]|nr:MotA/TolQ/ExbB proton channel family protein [Lentisphaeraceae bacterium]